MEFLAFVHIRMALFTGKCSMGGVCKTVKIHEPGGFRVGNSRRGWPGRDRKAEEKPQKDKSHKTKRILFIKRSLSNRACLYPIPLFFLIHLPGSQNRSRERGRMHHSILRTSPDRKRMSLPSVSGLFLWPSGLSPSSDSVFRKIAFSLSPTRISPGFPASLFFAIWPQEKPESWRPHRSCSRSARRWGVFRAPLQQCARC